MLEQQTHRISFSRFLKPVYTSIGICLILSGMVWSFFILKGWIQFGHFPGYGDPEIISFNGLDRQLIGITLSIMFWGFCSWTFITIISILFKLKIITTPNLVLGLVGIILDLLIVSGPAFGWILD